MLTIFASELSDRRDRLERVGVQLDGDGVRVVGLADSHHRSPQSQAAIISYLISKGANPNSPDKSGVAPLHRAVRTRCAAAVHLLLQSGCDPIIKNKPGSTPFHLAVQNTGRGGSGADAAKHAQKQIIAEFLSIGLSPNLKDAKGHSVLDWAKTEQIRQLLSSR